MSVYTKITQPVLTSFLRNYPLGELIEHHGIAEGIENTNYRVVTTVGAYVLTIFERTAVDDLPFCVDLMAYLADGNIPSANPLAGNDGVYLRELEGKPALVVRHLPGASITEPDPSHCRAVGRTLAEMHVLTSAYPRERASDRGPVWHRKAAAKVRNKLSPSDRKILDDELTAMLSFDFPAIPQGVIHADLFRDNVLFEAATVTGFIDFYYAHSGALMYDLAVTAADWCFDPATGFAQERMRALCQSYAEIRPPGEREMQAWSACLRAAGLRFWLSRLCDLMYPRGGEITRTKDPEYFHALLLLLQQDPGAATIAWS